MNIHSSWHSDRIAAAIAAKKHAYAHRTAVKTMKTSDLYIKEYGEKAYMDWKLREEKINALQHGGEYSKAQIVQLRESSFRQMKAEGSRREQMAAQPVSVAREAA